MGISWYGNIAIAILIIIGAVALAIVAPIALAIVRLLNRTYLDPEWRIARSSRYNRLRTCNGADEMPLTATEQQILEALHAVPVERWGEVLRFLETLESTAPSCGNAEIRNAEDLLRSDLVGIWADRTDLGDSQAFARRLREKAERRGGGSHAPGQ